MNAIAIQHLVKAFGAQTVLDDLNLEALDGETMVVMGRSGCGKSVLLKHIIGLMKPDSGMILVGGLKRKYSSPSPSQRSVMMASQVSTTG